MLACFAAFGQYGNYKYTNYGTKSILLTGNVTGSVEDLGLTYYNPARLSLIESNGLSINAQAFEYQTVTLKDAIGQESSLEDSRFNSLPAMAAGTFSLLGTRFAYAYFRTNTPNIDLKYRSDLQEGDIITGLPGEERYTFDLRFNTRTRSQLYGLAWAFNVTDRLSLGVSLFGAYYTSDAGNNLEYAIQAGSGGVVFSQNRQSLRQDSYGLLSKIGLSYVLPGVDLGLNITLPYLELFGNGRFQYNDVLAGLSPEQDQVYDYRLRDLSSRQKSPLGLSFGAGLPIGRHKLHLNIDYIAALSAYQRLIIPPIGLGGDAPSDVQWIEERDAVFNFGLAAEIFLSDRVMLYSGFSTDNNAMAADSNVLSIGGRPGFRADSGEDFFHFGLGTGLNFSWADVTLGATLTQSTSNVPNPFSIGSESIDYSGNLESTIITSRWQFIVGLDIPFLDARVNSLFNNKE